MLQILGLIAVRLAVYGIRKVAEAGSELGSNVNAALPAGATNRPATNSIPDTQTGGFTCGRCRRLLTTGMTQCPGCKQRFQTPVPDGSQSQQTPAPKVDVQPGHRLMMPTPTAKLAIDCPNCGANLDKWRDSKLAVCSLCRAPLR